MNERTPIPNINIGQVYDQRYSDAEVHYDKLGNLAGFFGRNMPVHRHDRYFQVHYVKSGTVRVYLDDQQYVESGPMFFLTPPTIPHSFVTEPDADGHVLTVRQQLVWQLLEADPALAPGPQVAPACVALSGLEGRFADEARRLVLIEAHYLEHWPLSRYALGVGVTEARLNDVCRRIADLPSKRLILERLMQEAKRLLLFTGSSANEICYSLGFKDPAYFSRFFLRYAQVTPGEYRQRQAGVR